MTIDNAISLISAIIVGSGTIFLGIMALRAIRQTRDMQKSEKREKLLNEIIDWAIDVSKCGIGTDHRLLLDALNGNSPVSPVDRVDLAKMTIILEEIYSFNTMAGRSRYISNIVSMFGQDLQNAVEELRKHINEHVKFLNNLKKDIRDASKEEKVYKHKILLNKRTRQVIEEACKIKL